MRLIDIDDFYLIDVCLLAGLAAKGAFSYQDVRKMKIKHFKYLEIKSRERAKELYGDEK